MVSQQHTRPERWIWRGWKIQKGFLILAALELDQLHAALRLKKPLQHSLISSNIREHFTHTFEGDANVRHRARSPSGISPATPSARIYIDCGYDSGARHWRH